MASSPSALRDDKQFKFACLRFVSLCSYHAELKTALNDQLEINETNLLLLRKLSHLILDITSLMLEICRLAKEDKLLLEEVLRHFY
jgi:hypothetical protein